MTVTHFYKGFVEAKEECEQRQGKTLAQLVLLLTARS